jgi:chorismate mutase
VHCNPDEAWSDAKQQITPPVYAELIKNLTIRTEQDAGFLNSIEALRVRIDETDNDILSLLSKRMEFASDIGEYKKRNNISILQPTRWNEILNSAVEKGRQRGLSDEFVISLLTAVHQESIRRQTLVMNKVEAKKVEKEEAVMA